MISSRSEAASFDSEFDGSGKLYLSLSDRSDAIGWTSTGWNATLSGSRGALSLCKVGLGADGRSRTLLGGSSAVRRILAACPAPIPGSLLRIFA